MKPSMGAILTVLTPRDGREYRASCGDPTCRFVTAPYPTKREAKAALKYHRGWRHL